MFSENDIMTARTSSLADNHHSSLDLTIRTSDGAEFPVFRERVAAALPLFATILALPQPATHGSNTRPCVDVHETSKVWEQLAPICHFTAAPPLVNPDDIYAILKAAEKYDLPADMMPSRMRYVLLQPDLLEKEPFRVYFLATAYHLPDVARAAAQRTLRLPTVYGDNFSALADVPAIAYYRLLDYRKRCSDAAKALTHRVEGALPTWIANEHARWQHLAVTCHGSCALESCTLLVHERNESSPEIHVRIRSAWLVYLDALGARLEAHPHATYASSPELLEAVVSSALDCHRCAKGIYRTACSFSRIMEEKIKDAISHVPAVDVM
ncbi:hypothetical protein C8Q76DRAFT_751829 [Earliella scabrosa]|nr:hypothetical protein C8Q76DRAFT_751829 [Earliella scabrosa]